jgi:lipoprotein NlpI
MKGYYDKAINLFDKVLMIEKDYKPAIYNKGLALIQTG